VPKINLNHLSYAAILLNLWVLFVGFRLNILGIQFLAIFNMIMLTLGLLLSPRGKKEEE
jgi:hypothetical protein